MRPANHNTSQVCRPFQRELSGPGALLKGGNHMASLGQPTHSLPDRQPPWDLAWTFQIRELEMGNTN